MTWGLAIISVKLHCPVTPGLETIEIYKGLELAADALRDAGHEVVEVDPPLILETAMAGYRALMGEVIELLGPDIRKLGSSEINRIFDEYFKQFKPYTGTDLLKILAKKLANQGNGRFF